MPQMIDHFKKRDKKKQTHQIEIVFTHVRLF